MIYLKQASSPLFPSFVSTQATWSFTFVRDVKKPTICLETIAVSYGLGPYHRPTSLHGIGYFCEMVTSTA